MAQKYTNTVAKCEEIDESTMKIHIFMSVYLLRMSEITCAIPSVNEFVPKK